ncbi:hypothetical protein Belba_3705 [Belliella baltica DSM 15883]|uniref:Uncharacterized protein n=1 Tax=Belliella baltica (strain DSM 15883 / CIP 108006 / LMG 21964 / BA134) TaxID=866536 RepID=I3ZAC5_BELBD|nr:hypothetical protein [Belliella baltica]AFL86193.1 hypothetical protein Belba_3705 [Belliella baltica DSM 15883]
MIHCRPKKNTYFSLSLVLLILISGLIYILNDFANTRSFGLIFYLISASLITVVILMLLVKMMAGYKFISAGKEKIITRLPLRGQTKTYDLSEILAWDEEKVMANKKEFKQLTVAFADKMSFTMSNHEHLNYEDFVQYLIKKAGKKRVKSR